MLAASGSIRGWTNDEVELLRQNVNKLNDWDLAEALGKTQSAVRYCKRKHRILQERSFTASLLSLARGGNGIPMSHAERSRRYKLRYPLEDKAHDIVSACICNGILVPQPCELCSSVVVDAHHDDYSKPLEVRWLCRRHHYRRRVNRLGGET